MAKRILYIEDDIDTAEVMSLFLSSRGYQVFHHDHIKGYEPYLNIVRQVKPDLILSDIFVPDVDGRNLCEFIRQHEEVKSIPYILYSAMHLSEEQKQALCGDVFITKPFDLDKFEAAIQQAFAKQTG